MPMQKSDEYQNMEHVIPKFISDSCLVFRAIVRSLFVVGTFSLILCSMTASLIFENTLSTPDIAIISLMNLSATNSWGTSVSVSLQYLSWSAVCQFVSEDILQVHSTGTVSHPRSG